MKPRWHIRNWGIRSRILFLTLVPVFVATMLLTGYFIHVRLNDVNRDLQERGRLLVQHLAPASEFGLFAGNRSMLKTATEAAVQEPDVRVVTVVGSAGQMVVRSQREGPVGGDGRQPGDLIAFTEPVYQSGVDLAPVDEQLPPPGGQRPRIIGWVVVGMDTGGVAVRQQEIMKNTLLLVAAALILGVLLARRIGRGVAEPVLELHSTVERIGHGELGARARIAAGGELGQLAHGLNEMAGRVQYAQERLEERVSEATAELRTTVGELEQKNRELEEAREKALQAGQEKAQFLANMSHEIRTPVNAVIGFTELLGRTALEGEQQEYARTIQQAGHQLTRIIDDILDVSKLEAGTVVPEQVLFSPRAALEDVLVMLRPTANNKGLELALWVGKEVPSRVRGDPSRFRQVLTNLVNNAIKFTDAGSVEVTAGYDAGGAPGRLRVTVQDTGIGIDEDQRRRLFRAFSQGDASITRRFGGTGLGLVIAERLVALMGGRIELDSAAGEGSTFSFELPIAAVEAAPLAELAGPPMAVCEAHPFSRQALAEDLTALGYPVREAADPEAALAAGTDIAGLVLGVGKDQAEPERLRALLAPLQRAYTGPVLLLVGTEEARSLEEAVDDPRVRVLPKPARLETLQAALQLLPDAPAGAAAESAEPAARFAGLRALVAEDNAFNRRLLETFLQNEGIEVEAAVDGEAALERLAESPFDLVFMDVHMPKVDGFEATRRTREEVPGGAALPIIAVTADVFSEEHAELVSAGVDDWLFKPINAERLRAVLERWAPRPAAGPPAAAAATAIPEKLWARLLGELPQHLERLQQAAADDDGAALRKQAHELHGLAGYFGIADLREGAKALEHAIKQGAWQAVPQRLERVRDLVNRVLADGS